MAERRGHSLLEFAIAASLAIVPVMLGMLWLVAVVRPTDPQAAAAGERYRSVRHVAALKTFEEAVVERAGSQPMATSGPAVLAGLPVCRREWGASWRSGDWLPFISHAGAAVQTPAERVAASLGEFDAALLRFSTRANARVSRPLGFDLERWFAAASRGMAQPLELPELPGQRFQLGCADLATALTALLRQDARMLDTLAWRGTVGSATLARWRPEQQVEILAQQLTRRNPWNGIAGCVYLGEGGSHYVAAERSAQRRLCGLPQMASAASTPSGREALVGEPGLADAPDDSRWMVPPSLQAMLQPLESLRQPSGALYRLVAEGDAASRNRVTVGGAAIDVGYSIDLTIDPATQALAQKTAACYTGRHDVCEALGIQRAEDKAQPIGHKLLEGAMVRMAAVAVVDVASGRIEALAGAMSPCARQEVDGPGRDAGCDTRLPYPVQYRPDALLNPAVFHDAMPASTIKPIMAASFLSDPEVGARWLQAERSAMQHEAETAHEQPAPPARESLRGQLMRSDSARFLDRMFCSDKGYDHCRRPWEVQAAAGAFGWNAGCTSGSLDCGKADLLFGRTVDTAPEKGPLPALSMPFAYGRLLSEPMAGKPGAPMHLMPASALKTPIVSRCAVGADGRRQSDDDWTKCKGGAVVDVVAEGWGQGHARASALGIAGMMATLAAAANGQAEVHRPHLVAAVHGAGRAAPMQASLARWSQSASEANRVSPEAAEVILSGLSYSHRAGTARTACEQVFDAQRCRSIDWLAGKTGTPSFPNDGVSLDELAKACPQGAAAGKPLAVKTAARSGKAADKPIACSSLRPYKWYVAAYRADAAGTGPWTKVIAVLTERNWLAQSGVVHGAGDHGPNPAAEIAMQITGRQVGLITGASP